MKKKVLACLLYTSAQYLERVRAKSPYRCEDALPEGAPVVTLSTCYGAAGSTQRFVVHGVQDKKMEY